MKKTLFSIIIILSLFSLLSYPVLAQPVLEPIVTDFQGVQNLLLKAVKWAYTIFFILAILFILLGAYTFLMSEGRPEKVKEGVARLKYAVIAIVIALISTGVAAIIDNFLRSGN
ncbi:MAG: hypothetical protein WC705_02425 [Candidatus Paceibacterota bacterium]|jgi:hypothetical protein